MKRITKIEANEAFLQKKKIKVAAYCRVSTSSDEQLVSLETQKTHYEQYIRSNGDWEYAGLFYDKGVTGTKTECREGLLSLVTACEKGMVDLIITKSISRFSRNITDCLELVRKLLGMNISIYFEKENINTGKMNGEFMLSILSSLAENESVSISKNGKWLVQKRFLDGTYIVAYPPYGYENKDRKMMIVPEEARIVKQIYENVLEGKSAHAIAKELNEKGIKSKRGGKWTSTSVCAMIRNEKYTGDVVFQKTYTDSNFNRHRNNGELDMYSCKGHHEPIVSCEVFEMANNILDQHAREKGGGDNTERYKNRYAFSGKIKCGGCGRTFKRRIHYKPSGDYAAWCCSGHIENKDSCRMKYITDESIKNAFLTMMNKLAFARKIMLKPLLNSLQEINDKEKLLEIQ